LTDSTVTDSETNNNGQDGVHIDGNNGAFVASITTNGNGGTGIFVFTSAFNSVIDSNASGNKIGIYVDSVGTAVANRITDNTANKNSKCVILLTCPTDAFGNTASGNAAGNLVTSDNTCLLLDNNAQRGIKQLATLSP
jgi:parallel beta-helix repeat protein